MTRVSWRLKPRLRGSEAAKLAIAGSNANYRRGDRLTQLLSLSQRGGRQELARSLLYSPLWLG
jgi:hypothetical protein